MRDEWCRPQSTSTERRLIILTSLRRFLTGPRWNKCVGRCFERLPLGGFPIKRLIFKAHELPGQRITLHTNRLTARLEPKSGWSLRWLLTKEHDENRSLVSNDSLSHQSWMHFSRSDGYIWRWKFWIWFLPKTLNAPRSNVNLTVTGNNSEAD